MTEDRSPTDDQLLAMMKDALDNTVEVSPDAIDMLMTGYDIVHADVVVADLAFDSLAATGVRGAAGPARVMRYASDGITLEFEIDGMTQRCVGSVMPPGGLLYLEQMGDSRSVDLTDSGDFATGVGGVGPFRLRYESAGSNVATEWLQLPASDT